MTPLPFQGFRDSRSGLVVTASQYTNHLDGSSQYSLQAGVFRLVCSNGMVVADSLLNAIKIRHTGNVIDMVIDGSSRILENAPIVNDTIQQWKQIALEPTEQLILANAAHSLRFDESSPITPAHLLNPRRRDDAGSDLWSTFNRIQEHVDLRNRLDVESQRTGAPVTTLIRRAVDFYLSKQWF